MSLTKALVNYTNIGMGLDNWSNWATGIRVATRRGVPYPPSPTSGLAEYYTVSNV